MGVPLTAVVGGEVLCESCLRARATADYVVGLLDARLGTALDLAEQRERANGLAGRIEKVRSYCRTWVEEAERHQDVTDLGQHRYWRAKAHALRNVLTILEEGGTHEALPVD